MSTGEMPGPGLLESWSFSAFSLLARTVRHSVGLMPKSLVLGASPKPMFRASSNSFRNPGARLLLSPKLMFIQEFQHSH